MNLLFDALAMTQQVQRYRLRRFQRRQDSCDTSPVLDESHQLEWAASWEDGWVLVIMGQSTMLIVVRYRISQSPAEGSSLLHCCHSGLRIDRDSWEDQYWEDAHWRVADYSEDLFRLRIDFQRLSIRRPLRWPCSSWCSGWACQSYCYHLWMHLLLLFEYFIVLSKRQIIFVRWFSGS